MNLALHSEDIGDAAWVKQSSTVVVNSTTSPDGNLTADKIIPDNASNGYLTQLTSFTSGEKYSASMFAKAAEFDTIEIVAPTSIAGSDVSVSYDLTNGVLVNSGADSAKITPLADGWFRCSISITAASTVAGSFQYAKVLSGDSSSGVYVFGLSIESLPFSTSYIKTIASAVARTKDYVTVDSYNNLSKGLSTVSLTVDLTGVGAGNGVSNFYSYRSTAIANNATFFYNNGDIKYYDGTNTPTLSTTTLTENPNNYMLTIDGEPTTSELKYYENGVLESIKSAGTENIDFTRPLEIGSTNEGNNTMYGHVKDFRAYDFILNSSEATYLAGV
jgi:hypothetical protein